MRRDDSMSSCGGHGGIPPGEDERLMALVQAGDRDACNQLVANWQEKSVRLARVFLYCGCASDMPGDIAAESLIKVWVHKDTYDQKKASFSTWFGRILQNACIDHARTCHSKDIQSMSKEQVEAHNSNRDYSNPFEALHVHFLLEKLPPPERLVFQYHYVEGYTIEATAAATHQTVSAVQHSLSRGRQMMRAMLGDIKQ
jgi:RNA polymerase sigma-70 factor (ECF subfamily)